MSDENPFAPAAAGAFFHKKRRIIILLGLLIFGVILYRFLGTGQPLEVPKPPLVRVAAVERQDIPVYFQGLGTVTPENVVTVQSRVDGELVAIHFTEGQEVAVGDLLAEIDPRPYELQLAEAEGAQARDNALLRDARLDLERYRKLVRQGAVTPQQLQAQEALVGQYEGSIRINEAAIASAKLQLTYCRITAPIAGRLGLRQADLGSMIRASDENGIVVITQLQPMQVIFTLVERQVPEVLEAMARQELSVEIRDQDNKKLLAGGRLLSLDNRIDTTTGTVRAKAVFENADRQLFPNQFVNARLLVRVLEQAPAIPVTGVQRNNDGFFAYVVKDNAVSMRPITTGYQTPEFYVVEQGLTVGDLVVTHGVDQLRDGIAVRIAE